MFNTSCNVTGSTVHWDQTGHNMTDWAIGQFHKWLQSTIPSRSTWWTHFNYRSEWYWIRVQKLCCTWYVCPFIHSFIELTVHVRHWSLWLSYHVCLQYDKLKSSTSGHLLRYSTGHLLTYGTDRHWLWDPLELPSPQIWQHIHSWTSHTTSDVPTGCTWRLQCHCLQSTPVTAHNFILPHSKMTNFALIFRVKWDGLDMLNITMIPTASSVVHRFLVTPTACIVLCVLRSTVD